MNDFRTGAASIAAALILAPPLWAQNDPHAGHKMPPAEQPADTVPAPDSGRGDMPADMPMDRAAMGHDMTGHDSASPMAAMGSMSSGTSRLPDKESQMRGLHFSAGDWMLMAHGYAWGVYSHQGGPRGDNKAFVASMAMLDASRDLGDGARLKLRTMLSLDPLMGDRGYPNLLATGETAGGVALIDRQHPHDLFMELSARLDIDTGTSGSVFLYAAPVGEPALGPPAFMHRRSSRLNPEAPITHHWFDSTHITFGVVTAGYAAKTFQIESSAFRGREPDEQRWDIETPKFDSWSVRGTWTPAPQWAAQVSYGRLESPEALHAGEDEGRLTASVGYATDALSVTGAFSAKNRLPGPTLTAWLLEANWDITQRHGLFGRFENVENDELFPEGDPLHGDAFRVSKMTLGYGYTIPLGRQFNLALGGSGSLYDKPAALDGAYGKNPFSYTLFAKLSLGR